MNESPVSWIWIWQCALRVSKTINISMIKRAGKKLVWYFIYYFTSGATHSDSRVLERPETERCLWMDWHGCHAPWCVTLGTQVLSLAVPWWIPCQSFCWPCLHYMQCRKWIFSWVTGLGRQREKKIITVDYIHCSQQFRKSAENTNKWWIGECKSGERNFLPGFNFKALWRLSKVYSTWCLERVWQIVSLPI